MDEGRDPTCIDFTKFVERAAALADTEGGREQAATLRDRYGIDAAKNSARSGNILEQDYKPKPKITTIATETKETSENEQEPEQAEAQAASSQQSSGRAAGSSAFREQVKQVLPRVRLRQSPHPGLPQVPATFGT